jgi:tetratricopeptide (TPR) repeat protein
MKWPGNKIVVVWLAVFLFTRPSLAENSSFTNLLTEGERLGQNGDVSGALRFYSQAEHLGYSNAADLCVLTQRYCDLMYTADLADAKKDLLAHAFACASQAVKDDPHSSTAHACMAVCYAKECSFANIKARVAFSRLFKDEADKAIALNPREDVAYYLLGQWNYAVANIGFLARTYVKVVYGGLPSASNEEAIHDFQKAIAIAPGHNLYYAGLASVYQTMGQKNLARAALRKCAVLSPLDRDDRDARQDAIKELNSPL